MATCATCGQELPEQPIPAYWCDERVKTFYDEIVDGVIERNWTQMTIEQRRAWMKLEEAIHEYHVDHDSDR